MPKTHYMPKTDAAKAAWLTQLGALLPTYAVTLGISPSETAVVQDDAEFFAFALNAQSQVLAYAQQWTSYKNAARDGGPGSSMGTPPVAPVFAPPSTIVAPGIIARTTALVGRIKVAPGYTDAIGQALQIVGGEHTVDVNTLKPVITAELEAGQVVIRWKKAGMDALEILVDRGAGFGLLAIDTVPDYTDTQAMPAAGQSALWKYKAIYRLGDDRVGQWSDLVSLPVAG